jgi:preprotein translocase subunit SecF
VFSKVDFVGRWRLWFAISCVLIAAGITAIALGNLNFGIDFEGGTKFTVASPDRHPGEGGIRQALPGFVARDAVIQTAGNGYEVRTPVLSQEQRSQVEDSLREALGGEVSETSVSPTFGGQVRDQALQAVAAAMLIIVAFISVRFEFAFALAAMVALLHDILITVGFYAIVGREVTLVTVVAVLTVLGYSLYDTIIIFDRVRENTPRVGYNRRRFDETVNTSITLHPDPHNRTPDLRRDDPGRLRFRPPRRHRRRHLQLHLYRLARPVAVQGVARREASARALGLGENPSRGHGEEMLERRSCSGAVQVVVSWLSQHGLSLPVGVGTEPALYHVGVARFLGRWLCAGRSARRSSV